MTVTLRTVVPPQPSRWPAVATGVIWLLVGLSAAVWFWRLWGHAPLVPVPVATMQRQPVDSGTVARALGAGGVAASAPAEGVAGSRLALLGVVRDVQGQGAALIAENGQAAKPYRVGDAVPGGWVLRGLDPRQARLGPADGGAAVLRLTLPVDAAAEPLLKP